MGRVVSTATYPRCDDPNGYQGYDAWNEPKSVESSWNGKNADADLCLDHQECCANPSYLRSISRLLDSLCDWKLMRLIYIPVVWAIFFDISKYRVGDCDLLLQVKAFNIAMFVRWNVVGWLDC